MVYATLMHYKREMVTSGKRSRFGPGFGLGLGIGVGLILGLLLCCSQMLVAQETIVAIRHAEKPPASLGQLSCQGLNRALALPKVLIPRFGRPAAIFAPDPGDEVNVVDGHGYSYVRPLVTIEPTAIELVMPVNTEIGYRDIGALQAAVTASKYHDSLVFISWEHGKLNDFAKLMLRTYGENPDAVPDWPNSDYDRIYVFKINEVDGKRRLAFSIEHQGLDGKLSSTCPGQ